MKVDNKQNRGKKTQKRILDTALKLFTEKGYDNVTVDEICEKSNSSKGSFYQHFSSKSSIFLAKFFEVDDHYAEVIKDMPEHIDVYEKISIFFHKALSIIDNLMGKDLMKVIYSSALVTNEHAYFLNKERELTKIFMSFAEELRGKHPLDSHYKVEDIVMMMEQVMMGMIYYWCISQDDRTLPEQSKNVIDAMINGFKNLK